MSNHKFLSQILKELLEHTYLMADTLNIDYSNHDKEATAKDVQHLLDSAVVVQDINNLSHSDSNKYFKPNLQNYMGKIITYINTKRPNLKRLVKISEINVNLAIRDIDPKYQTEVKKSMK